MSLYYFLSTNDKSFPNLLNPKKHTSDGRAVNVFACEEDLHELEIIKDTDGGYADVSFYTKLPYIYTVDWQCTPERCRQLIRHLIKNAKKNHKYELHRIWLANARSQRSFREDIEKGLGSVKRISVPLKSNVDFVLGALTDALEQGEFLRITFYFQ